MFRMISMIYKHLWDNYMELFNNLFYLLIFQRWSVTPERKKSRSEDLDKILESFWPERSDARERLSERQQAFFVLTTDQRKVKGERALSLITVWHENVLSTEVMSHDTNNNNNNHLVMFLSDGRNLELNAAMVHGEGVSRGIWDEDWGLPKASKQASWSTWKTK